MEVDEPGSMVRPPKLVGITQINHLDRLNGCVNWNPEKIMLRAHNQLFMGKW
ncbi:MAG: hypothetical protein RL090_1499 [Bacteroidota bacterium]